MCVEKKPAVGEGASTACGQAFGAAHPISLNDGPDSYTDRNKRTQKTTETTETRQQDKQADALREKLAARLEHAPGGPREWRWLAFCLGQLGFSERAARRLAEMTKQYKHALGEDEVRAVGASRRLGGGSGWRLGWGGPVAGGWGWGV